MWGKDGGPGTIYRLDPDNGYRPAVFATVTLDGRRNTGAALGNIAFDRVNDQFLVSDLETGMLHRIRASDGRDLGRFDHGKEGRPKFFDVPRREANSLPSIVFDPSSRAAHDDCAAAGSTQPAMLELRRRGRRIWGLGVAMTRVRTSSRGSTMRSGAARRLPTRPGKENDDAKRNSVWSVRLGPNGGLIQAMCAASSLCPTSSSSRRTLPVWGYSSPVSDITFAECGDRPVMLVAERGGIRNLGLAADNAFSQPHTARTLRYELDVTALGVQSGATMLASTIANRRRSLYPGKLFGRRCIRAGL